ncbi:SDR family oxidoreductase [Sphingomonadaceae bacterium G21617-S1]|nr:SDR family oxidoreductase [Sphingomonadaceae bacterium G21617-S1]
MIGAERQSRVAIVTGGSRGLGRAIATRVAGDGFAVIVNYRREEEAAAATVGSIIAAGGRAAEVQGDVARPDDVKALFDRAEAMFGGVDVVVNCAGIMTVKPLADYDLSAFDAMVSTNVRGTFLVSQQAARRVRPGGAIINMSTSAERQAMPGYGPYAMTKGAVEGLTMVLAREMKGRNITVNAIAPGPTATDGFLNGKSTELVARIADLNPFGRIAEPLEIAEIVAFLIGTGRWINGQVIFANGGMN